MTTAGALSSPLQAPTISQVPSDPAARIRRNTKLSNRFEAEHFGDHTLHSTVSAIERRYGICVERREEVVCGYGGNKTRVMRYWLSDDERKRAVALLGWRED